jgi:hypothetical protein
VFRRRRSADDEPDEAVVDETEQSEGSGSGASEQRPGGPWDESEAPDDDLPRIDLGALLVPMAEGLEVRVDVQEQTVVAATLVDGHSAMQVHAFAAPKSSGIWLEVRDEIATSIRQSGGVADNIEGDFGPELRARVPAAAAGQPPGAGPAQAPMRFLGVDGPRWFLRGLLTGPAATDPLQARRLLDVFRGIVVVRGPDAMAPRDMLPLRLPKEALEQQPQPAEPPRTALEMLERGPEITETR